MAAVKKNKKYALGVDYGTNSVRSVVVDVADGTELAAAVFNYPSGDHGILLDPKDPNLARQNPADYIAGFYKSVSSAVRQAKKNKDFDSQCGDRDWRRYNRFDPDARRP